MATITKPESIAAAIEAFNNLSEAVNGNAGLAGCGSPVGIQYSYAVTFHWPGHALAVDPGQSLCGVAEDSNSTTRTSPRSSEKTAPSTACSKPP